MIINFTDRRNDGSGTTYTDFRKFPDFLKWNNSLFYGKAKIFLRNINKGTSCN